MGYYTTFDGTLRVTPAVQPHHRAYLDRFFAMPHYRYNVAELENIKDPYREAVGLPLGPDGAFAVIVDENDDHWASDGIRVDPPKIGARDGLRLDGPNTPRGQPMVSTWCAWNVAPDGDDGDEFQLGQGSGDNLKAYGFREWLVYCLKHFFVPWGYKVNGTVDWQGEDRDDMGRLEVRDNHVTFSCAKILYEPYEEWSPTETTNEET